MISSSSAGISANEVKQDVTSEMVIGVLDSKEELKESENDAPKLETPLREEPRLAPQASGSTSKVLKHKGEDKSREITDSSSADDIRKVVGELAKDISITKVYDRSFSWMLPSSDCRG